MQIIGFFLILQVANNNFCRGYVPPTFKEFILSGSRTDTFDRDSVLQETLILKGKKQKLNGHLPSIHVTHSIGIKDIESFTEKIYKANELIDVKSKEKIFIFLQTKRMIK